MQRCRENQIVSGLRGGEELNAKGDGAGGKCPLVDECSLVGQDGTDECSLLDDMLRECTVP